MLSDNAQARIRELKATYPQARSAVMPALYIAQQEYGWLPQEAIDQVAALMGMTSTEVGSVASFYTMYHLTPVGEHVIDFCIDLPCALRGAEAAYERLRGTLGLTHDSDTNAERTVTLRPAPCLGGCDKAPVLLLDNAKQYENMTDEKLDALLDELNVMEKQAPL